jgi:hypothetical protein
MLRSGGAAAYRYLVLTAFAIAFGVEEAIIVLYLRLLPAHAPDTYRLEVARELCTIVILVAVAAFAGSRLAERLRYFFFTFGAWDIVYYAALWLFSRYPGISSDDVLFLIPIPWVGPVWAAVSFAAALVFVGLRGTAPARGYVLIVGLILGWLSFVYVPATELMLRHSLDVQLALGQSHYPLWLFVPAVLCVLLAVDVGDRFARK